MSNQPGDAQAIAFAQHIMMAAIFHELAQASGDPNGYLERMRNSLQQGADEMPINIDAFSDEKKAELRERAKPVIDMVIGMVGRRS